MQNFSLQKKTWGPQRKDFGGGYGFPCFYRVFVSTTGLESSSFFGQKSSPKDFLSVVVVYAFFFSEPFKPGNTKKIRKKLRNPGNTKKIQQKKDETGAKMTVFVHFLCFFFWYFRGPTRDGGFRNFFVFRGLKGFWALYQERGITTSEAIFEKYQIPHFCSKSTVSRLGALQKARLSKAPFSGDFWGFLIFSGPLEIP